jgi:subtilisin family serine protease
MDQSYPSKDRTETRSSCTSVIVLILAWLYTAGISYGRIGIALVASALEYQLPESTPFTLALGQAILLLVPLGLLALFWKEPRFAGIFRSWWMAAGFVLLLAPVHFTRPYMTQQHALLHILLAGVYILLLRLLNRRPRVSIVGLRLQRQTALGVALLVGAVFAYPWLAWGALGSLLDTVLQFTSALLIGFAAALIVENGLVQAFRSARSSGQQHFQNASELSLAGLGASAVLLVIASGTAFGFGGMQLMMMLSLPSLGWVLAWLSLAKGLSGERLPGGILPMGLLTGLAAAAPMILVDPSELHFLVSVYEGEIFQLALSAAGVSALIGLILSALAIFIFARQSRQGITASYEPTLKGNNRPLLLIASAWGIGAFIYFVFGQPGFYGESLFVILKEQANLPVYTPGNDYYQHRALVYTTLVNHAIETQAGLQTELDRFRLSYTPYYLVNALEVRGGPLIRWWLSSRPEVDRVLLNPWMRPLPSLPVTSPGNAPPPQEIPWNLALVRANQVWNELGVTGEGIIIGQSDSGVQADHPELAGNYRGKDEPSSRHDYNWFDPWYNSEAPYDLNGHGTHTLAIATGLSTGVAPGATWYSCANLVRVFGNPALYLDCMQFMLVPFPVHSDPFLDGDATLGAHVVNNSWGCPELEGCDATALLPAVQALRSAGVFMAVSAGNDGPACETVNAPLALYEEVFSVGAIDSNGQLLEFSSRGPVTADGSSRTKPDLLAPGFDVLSAYPSNSYSALPGTSMAGPHITGAVALIWSANPALIGDIDRTEQVLARSAHPYSGPIPACPGADEFPSTAYGYGVLDAYSAVLLALDLPAP